MKDTIVSHSAASNGSPICSASGVQYSYGNHAALRGVEIETHAGEIVALLGKNGSGKTTLFRLLSTLLPIQSGSILIAGLDARENPLAVRGKIGIVFQSPSLDKKLTVDENIACQASLYGIRGQELNSRRDAVLEQMGLTDRRGELCETLSGGLKRRVEIAKGMLHRPSLMLLDEPSTGLDPAARINLHRSLKTMAGSGVSILMTTHLLEEAEKADRVVILNEGQVVCAGTPGQLRSDMGEGVITIVSENIQSAYDQLKSEFELDVVALENHLRIRCGNPARLVPAIHEKLGDELQSITVGRPNLEDVFIEATGQSFDEVDE